MLRFVAAWFLTATGFAAILAIDDWLGAALYARLALIAAAALAFLTWSSRAKRLQQPDAALAPTIETPPLHTCLAPSELNLAIEHIESIRVLLQVSAAHNQPIPRASLVNLDLVVKNLKKLTGCSSAATDDERAPMMHVVRSAPALAREN